MYERVKSNYENKFENLKTKYITPADKTEKCGITHITVLVHRFVPGGGCRLNLPLPD